MRERIAHGLVHVAALALDNAQLVAELEQSNAIKTYFAATMSHELRNTVFAIGGFSEMLVAALQRRQSADPVRLAQTIGERARESLQLIQAALEMTRSEVRPTQPDERELALAELVEPLRREMDALVQRARRSPSSGIWRRELPPLQTDAVKLRMVLKNLIGNAVKFTERGAIRVTADRAGERVRLQRLRHRHRHPGRGAAARLRAVPPGARTHARAAPAAPGSASTSSTAWSTCSAARSRVDSAPGRGTTFAIELPLAPPPALAQRALSAPPGAARPALRTTPPRTSRTRRKRSGSDCAPSWCISRKRCTSTVRGLTPSSAAITLLGLPAVSPSSTARWRGVSLAKPAATSSRSTCSSRSRRLVSIALRTRSTSV